MLKGALKYSKIWSAVKKAAKIIVKNRLNIAGFLNPATIALWDQVTVAPDKSSINVLTKGTSHGDKTSIPFGGYIPPISWAGDKLEWKKAQKKAKKNIISDAINRSIPHLIPICTEAVCCPSKVASLIISLHQTNIIYKTVICPVKKQIKPPEYWWTYNAKPIAIEKTPIEHIKAHGDGSTKWNGCFWLSIKDLLFKDIHMVILMIYK